ncbi:hypothetical protein [Bacillus sp. UNC41MFS5]|uniref:hypothetical protein n=1 Tax=Bacillus sp. UNC41MFS5 TaxID=1449046 RepID=UPI00047AAA92|nr:hypothetical protein [Bacillus sp. UNC41MFS5]
MVTAIVIPIICLYFYWLTKKEMKENDSKWANAGNVQHEAILTGEIKSIIEEKQRFYYHRYIHVQSLRLQTETKLITVQKITPLTKDFQKVSFKVGEVIRVYGKWEHNKFLFNEYISEKR